MLIGGKTTNNETKRSTKKQRSAQAQKEDSTATAATSTASNTNVENSSTTEVKAKDSNKETAATAVAPSTSTAAASSSLTANSSLSSSKDKENNDPKSSTNGQQSNQTNNNETATTSNGGNGINKKIPKHKWRPLQIDLAKSSRSKSIGRPTRRGITSQSRYHERSHQRGDGSGHERRSNVQQHNETQRNATGERNTKKSGGGPNERIDSWRSGSGAERSNDREYERPARTQRRFRTSYRGGRQGRGGFSRSGPGRTSNRIPRHLLTNGEYANYLPADAAGTDQSFVLMGTHYYGPMPAAYIEMDAQSVKEAIKKQV